MHTCVWHVHFPINLIVFLILKKRGVRSTFAKLLLQTSMRASGTQLQWRKTNESLQRVWNVFRSELISFFHFIFLSLLFNDAAWIPRLCSVDSVLLEYWLHINSVYSSHFSPVSVLSRTSEQLRVCFIAREETIAAVSIPFIIPSF
jgi:hypothetical protein